MQWKIVAGLPGENGKDSSIGIAGPVTGYYNNYLLIAGGANFPDAMPWEGGKKEYQDEAYLFSRDGERLSLYDRSFKLTFPLAYAASCSTKKGIVVAGGENAAGISSKVWLISWSESPDSLNIDSLPDLPLSLTNAAAVVVGSIVYVVGGETANAASDAVFCLDLDHPDKGWAAKKSLPVPVSHSVLAYNAGKSLIYLIGGRKKNENAVSTFYSAVYTYDPENDEWNEETKLPYALSAGTGFTVDNLLILIGGDKGKTFNQTEKLILAIQNENSLEKIEQLTDEKNILQNTHPGFSKEILIYNLQEKRWEDPATFPFETPVTTTAVKMNDQIILPSGEIKAGVRTPKIIMGTPGNLK